MRTTALRLSPRQQLTRYALALGLAAGAVALQWLVRPWVGPRIPFLFMLPALVLASTWAGRGPGLLVLLIGLLNAAFWLPPTGSMAVDDPQDQLSLTIYMLFALLLVQFGAHLRSRAERAQATEERLLLAVEDSGIGIFDIDLATQTVQISPTLARLARMPVPAGEIALTDWLDRLPREAVAESRAALIAELRASTCAYERELLLASADGDPRWLLLRVHIVWADRRATRLRGVAVDITDRKLVDAQLKRTKGELSQQVNDLHRLHELSSVLNEPGTLQARLQLILQTLADFHGTDRGLVSLFEDGLLTVEAELGFSEAGLALLKLARRGEGAGGLSFEQRQRVVIEDAQHDRRFLKFREFARLEGLRAMHSTPLISERGEVLGAISVYFDSLRQPTERERALADICARKAAIFIDRDRARDALEQTQDRFEAVLEAAAVPFCVLTPQRDSRGRISDFVWTYLNGAAAAVVGQPRHELLGRAVLEVLPGYWQHDAATFKHFVAVLEHGEVQQFESASGGPSGTGSFQYIASPMQDAVAVWFSDISERKRSEQRLQEADRRKDEFLATLAHELRNPLAPIRQAALLSKAPMATEAQKRWSHEIIDRQVQHMALLLDDLLDISRITRGALSLRIAAADLAAVVDAAIETARPLIDAKQHRLAVSLPDEPVRFDADALRLSQVVANLLVNAAKYTDAGGRLRLAARVVDGQLEMVVSDSGIGIAAESLDEVFQMFTQLHGAGEHSSGGLGIGLALTRGLVELHGGEVFARSGGTGQGSSFTVRMPMRHGTVQAVDAAAAGGGAVPALTVKPRKVLIADDNVDAAESLALLMQLQGHEVTLAFDGREAVECFRCADADVCLLDIGMPHLNGNEVAQAIRQLPGGARPVLVAITGWGQESDRSQSLAAGFDHHLTKPVDPERLTQLLASEPAARP